MELRKPVILIIGLIDSRWIRVVVIVVVIVVDALYSMLWYALLS